MCARRVKEVLKIVTFFNIPTMLPTMLLTVLPTRIRLYLFATRPLNAVLLVCMFV